MKTKNPKTAKDQTNDDLINVDAQTTDAPKDDQTKSDAKKDQEISDAKKLVADLETAFADAKSKLADAKKALRSLTGGKSKKEKSGPGVIATILSLVQKAPKKGISKSEILTKLIEMFPDRASEGMEKTINVQLPKRMSKERNVKIVKLESGNFVVEK